MLAAAYKCMPSSYVSLADTHPACTPANDHRYLNAHHLAPASVPGSKLYEEFHPFGTTSYAANDSGIEVSAKRYRYIGKERDEETGLYHCGARYLAAWLGRWTAADPIGLGDGVNRYAYARGNPVKLVDPGGTRAGSPDDKPRTISITVTAKRGETTRDVAKRALLQEFGERGLTEEEAQKAVHSEGFELKGPRVVGESRTAPFVFEQAFIEQKINPLLDKDVTLTEGPIEEPGFEEAVREFVGGTGTSESLVLLTAAAVLTLVDIISDLAAIKAAAKTGIKILYGAAKDRLARWLFGEGTEEAAERGAKEVVEESVEQAAKNTATEGGEGVADGAAEALERQKGGRFQRTQDALDQEADIEARKRTLDTGKRKERVRIDSIEKSKQRRRNELKRIKSTTDVDPDDFD